MTSKTAEERLDETYEKDRDDRASDKQFGAEGENHAFSVNDPPCTLSGQKSFWKWYGRWGGEDLNKKKMRGGKREGRSNTTPPITEDRDAPHQGIGMKTEGKIGRHTSPNHYASRSTGWGVINDREEAGRFLEMQKAAVH